MNSWWRRARVWLCLAGLLDLGGCSGPTAYRGSIIAPPTTSQTRDEPTKTAATSDATRAVGAQLRISTDPYLKCHFWDGTLILLEDWRVEGDSVVGKGIKYDSRRVALERSEYRVAIASVALFETNRPEAIKSARIPVMATVATTSLALTALCITTPKACFGSCPTIYATDGHTQVLQAEAFSSSIARSLEASDVDALSEVPAAWRGPELRVTNEAPETHAIRSLALLYAERPSDGHIYRIGDGFHAAGAARGPASCQSARGSCLEAVSDADGNEYKSNTDGEDLASKEHLALEFRDAPQGDLGIVLTARNSLLNTYLFYQALAYMGQDWGKYLAFIERGDEMALRGSRRIGELLGGIQVEVERPGSTWALVGEHVEIGPIARETVMVRVPRALRIPGRPLRVRLTMTRGNIRLDRVAMAQLREEIVPRRLLPNEVLRDGTADPEALSALLDDARYLVTYPGDEYVVKFPDAPCERCDWFVESRGYYYEWMREVWLPEQSASQLSRLLLTPDEALRSLAPAYQAIEPEIDRLFWLSRIPVGGLPRSGPNDGGPNATH